MIFLFVIFVEHIAIMKKSWNLTQKILSGKKKIESRWHNSKRAPFGRIIAGETVYFKDSREPVSICTKSFAFWHAEICKISCKGGS
ncbi:hypothetical protein D4Q76_00300 [archaeon]|nr:MAG: hypothetical protein D4Q76_00300 [archaeon]